METTSKSQNTKKPFNKQKWRETEYSHKHKVSEWEEKRKLAVKRKYNKFLKKDGGGSSNFRPNVYDEDLSEFDQTADFKKHQQEMRNSKQPHQRPERLSEYQRAKLEFDRIQKLKEEERLERAAKRKEREAAIEKSKAIRLERIKKLTQKTKKGQPVMRGRIEILLEKIQKQMGVEGNETT